MMCSVPLSNFAAAACHLPMISQLMCCTLPQKVRSAVLTEDAFPYSLQQFRAMQANPSE